MTNEKAIEILKYHKCPDGKGMDCGKYSCAEHHEAIDKAVEALKATTWIPCAEEVPENYADLIFCDRQGTVFFGHYNKYCDYWCADFCDDRIKSVVAWMPKPESYHE